MFKRKNMSKTNKVKKPFDPLLFNGLGSQRDRLYNRLLFVVMEYIPPLLGTFGLIHSFKYPFSPTYLFILNLCFYSYCITFIYVNLLFLKNGFSHKIYETTPLLICKKQTKTYDSILFVLFLCFMLAGVMTLFLCSAIFSFWLWYFYITKPFLLKKVLVYESKIVVQYRLYGDIQLDLESLVLIRKGLGKGRNHTFARIIQHKKSIATYCILPNIDIDIPFSRLEHRETLKALLFAKAGCDVDNISYPSIFGFSNIKYKE